LIASLDAHSWVNRFLFSAGLCCPHWTATAIRSVHYLSIQIFASESQTNGWIMFAEIEPGTYLVAAAGRVLCSVQDIVSTKSPTATADSIGFDFLKLDIGMNDVLRPSL
jgi:hypothetical protein